MLFSKAFSDRSTFLLETPRSFSCLILMCFYFCSNLCCDQPKQITEAPTISKNIRLERRRISFVLFAIQSNFQPDVSHKKVACTQPSIFIKPLCMHKSATNILLSGISHIFYQLFFSAQNKTFGKCYQVPPLFLGKSIETDYGLFIPLLFFFFFEVMF